MDAKCGDCVSSGTHERTSIRVQATSKIFSIWILE